MFRRRSLTRKGDLDIRGVQVQSMPRTNRPLGQCADPGLKFLTSRIDLSGKIQMGAVPIERVHLGEPRFVLEDCSQRFHLPNVRCLDGTKRNLPVAPFVGKSPLNGHRP